ncbi:MAG: hypothetical protein OWQ47_03245 [Acidianus infernus]|nr:hypothetical protein [Acidianus infernus]
MNLDKAIEEMKEEKGLKIRKMISELDERFEATISELKEEKG